MDAPLAYNSLRLGGLVTRHAKYRPRHTAVVVPGDHEVRLGWREFDAYLNRWANALALGSRGATASRPCSPIASSFSPPTGPAPSSGAVVVPLSPLLTAPGLASLLADSSPCVVHRIRRSALAIWTMYATARPRHGVAAARRRPTTARRLPRVWHAVAASAPNRACGRSSAAISDTDVHVRHHGHAERHPAHAFHPRDVRRQGELVADAAGIHRAALGLDRVQRGDDDDAAGVHARGDVRGRARLRSGSRHRDHRARTRHSHHARAVADHRDPERARASTPRGSPRSK